MASDRKAFVRTLGPQGRQPTCTHSGGLDKTHIQAAEWLGWESLWTVALVEAFGNSRIKEG